MPSLNLAICTSALSVERIMIRQTLQGKHTCNNVGIHFTFMNCDKSGSPKKKRGGNVPPSPRSEDIVIMQIHWRKQSPTLHH